MLPALLFSLAYAVVRFLLETLAIHARPNARLRAEVFALRHQLRVLEAIEDRHESEADSFVNSYAIFLTNMLSAFDRFFAPCPPSGHRVRAVAGSKCEPPDPDLTCVALQEVLRSLADRVTSCERPESPQR